MAEVSSSSNQSRGRNNGRRRGRNNDRTSRTCDYYNASGHTRDTCFQLNGYPNWYQQYKNQRENANMTKVEISKTPFDNISDFAVKDDSVTSMLHGIQQELDRIKGKIQSDGHVVNLTRVSEQIGNEYAGMVSVPQTLITAFHANLQILENLDAGSYTGATTHVCRPKIV